MRSAWLFSLVLVLASVARAEEPVSTADGEPGPLRLNLMDGSVIAGELSIKALELDTAYGTLSVPIGAIRSFTPGLESHPELGKQVTRLIEQLGSTDFDERELAQKELTAMGEPVRQELKKFTKDSDTERRTRVNTIIEEFDEGGDNEEDAAARKQWLVPHDVVETAEFTAVGRIATPSFTVTSLYGPLTIKLSDIRRGERSGFKQQDLVKEFLVDGGNMVQRSMRETGIRVEKGERIVISAEGQLTMTPWGNGTASSPEGGANWGWLVQGQIPSGCLVATIGNNTQWIKVGSRTTIKAPRTGVLKLGIAMQQDYANQEFPGGYQTKVVLQRN